ncbi:reverse transcriptase domain-containing protein [Tanacetum coccineum]
MADTRTMAELLQAPTGGFENAIVIPPFQAENFELKPSLITLVQSKVFRAGDNFLDKMPDDYLRIIESKAKVRHSQNSVSRVSTHAPPSSSSPSNVDLSSFREEITSTVKDMLAINLKEMRSLVVPTPATVKAVEEKCVICGDRHNFNNCPLTRGGNDFLIFHDNIHQFQQTAAVGNFIQRNSENRFPSVANQIRPPGFSQPNAQPNANRNNQGIMPYQAPTPQSQVVTSNELEKFKKTNDANLQAMRNHITNLKTELRSEMQTTMQNQNNGEIKVIITRSGLTYDGPPSPPTPLEPSKEVEQELEILMDQLPKPRERTFKLHKFLEMFKKLHFNISLAEALILMPKYTKMMKDLLSNKEKLLEVANTPLTENCSEVIMKKLPEKLGDPGRFLIPCDFTKMPQCMALADLGASINLMPLGIYQKLKLPELVSTKMSLELANGSLAYPTRIAKDELVKVGQFSFPADFVVVDYEVNYRVPLILGRPFLRTARVLIDVYGEELILRDDGERLVLKPDRRQDKESVNIVTPRREHSQEINNLSIPALTSQAPGPSRKRSRSPSSSFFLDATTFSDGKPASEASELNPEDVTAKLEDLEVEIDTLHADTEDKELLIAELQDSIAAAESEIAILQIRANDAESRRAEDHEQIQKILGPTTIIIGHQTRPSNAGNL